jgi:2-polyprenyl-3-methyl-5-hydroxy-6-metoxy-1,4-benzoquinol methylase
VLPCLPSRLPRGISCPLVSTPKNDSNFDYGGIPVGYYDRILHRGHPVRRLWHVSKFERVLDYLPTEEGGALLDIGCFAGTFLSLVPRGRFVRQVGVDILPEQIAYANENYGSAFRKFIHVPTISDLSGIGEPFNCISLIEVIEHLSADELHTLFTRIEKLLVPGGRLVLTTPNYTSMWPLIELALNRVSEVSYEEQHVTKFTYFNFEKKLASIYPNLLNKFVVDLKTTTHFVTPFLAAGSFELARGISRIVPHRTWHHPFGNLVLMVLTRLST